MYIIINFALFIRTGPSNISKGALSVNKKYDVSVRKLKNKETVGLKDVYQHIALNETSKQNV